MKKVFRVFSPNALPTVKISDPYKVAQATHTTKDGKVIKLGR